MKLVSERQNLQGLRGTREAKIHDSNTLTVSLLSEVLILMLTLTQAKVGKHVNKLK